MQQRSLETPYQRTLDVTYDTIINAIPSPTTLLSNILSEIFTATEEETVEQEESVNGARNGTRIFIKLLRNKSKKDFDEFLRALQHPSLQLQSLYVVLSEELKKQSAITSFNISCNKEYEDEYGQFEGTPQYYFHSKPLIPNSFLKDIPPRLACKLIGQLNVPDTLGKDWRGIADCLNLTHEQMIESSGKMRDMLHLMIQQNYKIEDLLKILKRIKRYDIIELFTCHEKWLEMKEKAVQTEAHKDVCNVSVQTNQSMYDSKLTCLNQSTERRKVEQTGFEIDDVSKISKQALIVANLDYNDLNKLDGLSVYIEDLKNTLRLSNWNICCYIDCPWREIKKHCDNFVKMACESVVFFYYIGHSVQIYSDNYLLSVDVSNDDNKADIILKSLNLSSFLKALNHSMCTFSIIDSGYKTGLTCPQECVLDGLSRFEPPLRSVVCLICSESTCTRKETSNSFYIRSFLECFKNKPVNLENILSNIEKQLFTNNMSEVFPLTLCKTKNFLPIILNDEVNILEKPPATFLVKKSALILLRTDLNITDYNDLCGTLRTQLWKACLVIYSDTETVYKKIKSFLKSSEVDMKVIFIFGSFSQEGNENVFVNNKAIKQDSLGVLNVQWIIDSCSLTTGHKVLILENIAANHNISLSRIDCCPQMLISFPKNNSYREKSTFAKTFADIIRLKPTFQAFLEFMFSVSRQEHHTIISSLFLL